MRYEVEDEEVKRGTGQDTTNENYIERETTNTRKKTRRRKE